MARPLFLILVLLCCTSAALAQPAEVNRVLKTFDFEERRLGNAEDLPMNWNKVEGPGLPHYVNGQLATDRPRGGKFAFRLDLNGGSLAYRHDAGRIRVQTGSHYRVEGYVQTTALPHARARLTAYLADLDGVPLPGTARHSDLYAARREGEGWQRVWVELSADSPKAASMVVEVALLQPQLYAPTTLGQRTLFSQDIRGSAWFDDVTVSQVPRVTMATDRPGNVFRRGDPLRLQVLVSDRFTDDLASQLRVHDAAGRKVHQRSGALEIATAETLGPGRRRLSVVLPELPPGWYEVTLEMTSRGQYVGEQRLDLVLLADNAPPAATPDDRFGVTATDLPFEGWAVLPDLLPQIGAGRVKLAVWHAGGDIEQVDSAAFDRMLVRLQGMRITPTACLVDLPPAIAEKMLARQRLVDAAQAFSGAPTKPGPAMDSVWPHLLKADRQDWQPQLAQLIARHANHLDRWQLGADGTDAFVMQPGMREVYDRVYAEFAALVHKPDLAMPWPAWYELSGFPATVALNIPTSVLPSQIPLYMEEMRGSEGQNLSVTLSALEAKAYGRDVQIRDFAQRVVHTLAAGAKRIDVPLPFRVRRDGSEVVKEPQEMLMITRTLITTLGGATFRGKVPIADGVDAFLFERGGQGVLAMWARGTAGGGVRQLAVNLGERPVQIDLWGNATRLLAIDDPKGPGHAALALGTMPVLLVGVDAQVAMLRASVAIDRPLIESSFKPHTRRLTFTNPFKVAISGAVRLKAPAGWTLNPPTQQFSLNPGETFDRELTIEFPYNSYAGAKTIEAQFTVQADKPSAFTVPLTLQLGLSDVGMQTLALRDGDDVVVQQTIQNYGDRPIDYGAFAIFPGAARQERLVTNLGPGRTTLKRYKFTGVKIAPGTKVRVGVKESNGSRILNDEVEVQ
jgi:urease beta subunit